MKIQLIYTFEKREQLIREYPVLNLSALQSKNNLINFAFANINDDSKKELIKISCCIFFESEPAIDLPKWYDECQGKIWFEKGIPSL